MDDALFREAEILGADDGRMDHVEAQGVGAVGVEDVVGVGVVLEALGHFASVFGEDEAVDDDVLVGGFSEQGGAEEHQGIEPAAGLVEAFGDEVGGEEFVQFTGPFEGVVLLGVGHGAGFEPAVEHFGGAAVGLAVEREGDLVHVVLVEVGDFPAGELFEFGDGADADHVLAVLGDPDGDAGAPEAVAGDVPVLGFLEPVAEALFADGLGDPMDGGVAFGEAVAEIFDADIPGLDGAVDQRGVGARAEGIGVDQGGLVHQLAGVFQRTDDGFVGVLAEDAVEFGDGFGEGADIVEIVAQGDAGGLADAEVVLAEGGGDVHEPGAVLGADEAVIEDAERAGGVVLEGIEDRLVGESEQVGAREGGEGFVLVGFLVVGGEPGFGEEIDAAVGGVADGDIGDIGSGADGEVAVEGPGGGGPDEGIDGGAAGLEAGGQRRQLDADGDGGVLDVLVVAAGLEVGEGGVELPGIGHDAVGLVHAALLPELLEHPPDGLHEGGVHRFVIVVEVHPAAHAGDGFAPFLDVGEHHGAAGFVEDIHAPGGDVGGAGEPELLLGEGLDGQAVAVPAETPFDKVSAHGLVARQDVFDGAGEEMAVVGGAGGERRAVVEDVFPGAPAVGDGLLERVVLGPEAEDVLLHFGKRHFAGNGLEHGNFLLGPHRTRISRSFKSRRLILSRLPQTEKSNTCPYPESPGR